MKLEMTERDKKLIVMLLIFVIVVCIGYWGIRPQIKQIAKYNKENKTLSEKQDKMQMTLAETPMLEKDNQDLEAQIATARKEYYDEMSSDAIEKYFTNMALDYHLYAYDLTMNISEDYTDLGAYQYSEKAQRDEEAEEEAAEARAMEEEKSGGGASVDAAKKVDDLEFGDMDDLEGLYAGTENVIHVATVSQKLGGKPKDLERFVDDISNIDKRLRVVYYSFDDERTVLDDGSGGYTVQSGRILNITVEIYMCVDREAETSEEE